MNRSCYYFISMSHQIWSGLNHQTTGHDLVSVACCNQVVSHATSFFPSKRNYAFATEIMRFHNWFRFALVCKGIFIDKFSISMMSLMDEKLFFNDYNKHFSSYIALRSRPSVVLCRLLGDIYNIYQVASLIIIGKVKSEKNEQQLLMLKLSSRSKVFTKQYYCSRCPSLLVSRSLVGGNPCFPSLSLSQLQFHLIHTDTDHRRDAGDNIIFHFMVACNFHFRFNYITLSGNLNSNS
jgi:hypothetical protein